MQRLKVPLVYAELEVLVELLGWWLQHLPRQSHADKWMVLTLAELYGRLFPRLSLPRARQQVSLRATEVCALAHLLQQGPLPSLESDAQSLLQRLYAEFDRRLA